MGGSSYQARRPSGSQAAGRKAEVAVGDPCPRCSETLAGVLTQVDDAFLTCDSCGYDVPLTKEKDGEETD
jgi:hypothetical protein